MKTNIQPQHPLAAVTYPDPYPYYRSLVEDHPIYYDDTLKLWVASSAEAVTAVLTSDLCRVRPGREPIPNVLLNSAAADIFGKLIRMNDGTYHSTVKQVVSTTLQGVSSTSFIVRSEYWSRLLLASLNPDPTSLLLSEYAFKLPVYVMGDTLGVSHDQLPILAEWVKGFVQCLSPLSSLDQIEAGETAAANLLDLFQSLLASTNNDGLLGHLVGSVGTLQNSTEIALANGIGFLSQAYEATAGLIGNTLVTLARNSKLLAQVKAEPALLSAVVEEVLRYDSPIQNTRRFVAESGVIAQQHMQAGDVILVVLAAANHDPAVNPDPERFDPFHNNRRCFSFGTGAHACPGQRLAVMMAQAGVKAVLDSKLVDIPQLANRFTYQRSLNARIPLFIE